MVRHYITYACHSCYWLIQSIFYVFEYILFPSLCSYCKVSVKKNEILCLECLSAIQPIVTQSLVITDTYKVTVYAIGAYQDPLQFLIRRKHYKDRTAACMLGHLIWQYTAIEHVPFDVIVPLPLHWTRYASRWFNQAYEMAKVISQYSSKPIICALNRHKKTEFQARKSREERFANVQKVFSLSAVLSPEISGKHILLVDDVMTTGATLTEAIRTLKYARPASITVVVAARV